jgi:hypothetical protein
MSSKIDQLGKDSGEIPIELSTRFLEHFSESLYSSPQKAFEELISNGWDAGADYVEVLIPDDLEAKEAALCVIDNGESMNEEGLKNLWHIAFSTKSDETARHGRQLIGKFGIGKLATYVLADKLTYICKSKDGIIRRVTMDYGAVADQSQRNPGSLINKLKLKLFELSDNDFKESLLSIPQGEEIIRLIDNGLIPKDTDAEENEYGGPAIKFEKPEGDTWTIAILSDLKVTGKKLKKGILKRMLEAALPIGSDMAIFINGDKLGSAKLDIPTSVDIVLGSDLEIDEIELKSTFEEKSHEDDDENKEEKKIKPEVVKLESGKDPEPYIEIPEVGRVYGRVRLYQAKIAGGKSEARGSSNGFFVNVKGRVINQADTSFGEENLSHAAWARFRMTIRADGLNVDLTTDRERVKSTRRVVIFRAFLRAVFNKMRTTYDSDLRVALENGGDILVNSLGVISLNPLRNIVSETLRGQPSLPGLFDDDIEHDREAKAHEWWENTSDNIRNAVSEVKYENIGDDSFVKFRMSDRSILINTSHPFVKEHYRSKAEKELMRTVGMVDLLSDMYALDLGIKPNQMIEIREYRDKLMRYRALQRRKSAAHVAQLLYDTQHKSSQFELFESAVGDALEHLGFHVLRLGKSGEPEGVASAFPYPTGKPTSVTDKNPPLYKFTYDAKSAKGGFAKTGNLSLDGIHEHKKRYKADYALVIAPGFSEGAAETRCAQQGITPITAASLAKLLEITFSLGAIPLTTLRDLFSFQDPQRVTDWVDSLEEKTKSERVLTIDIFIQALDSVSGQVPDVLSAGTISMICRNQLGASSVDANAVKTLVQGLSILVPDLIALEGDNLVVNVSANRLASAIELQLDNLHLSA